MDPPSRAFHRTEDDPQLPVSISVRRPAEAYSERLITLLSFPGLSFIHYAYPTSVFIIYTYGTPPVE